MDLEDKIELYLRGYEEGQKEAWNEIKGMVSRFEGFKLKTRVESKLGTLYQAVESKRVDLQEDPAKLKIEEEEEEKEEPEDKDGDLKFDRHETTLVVEEHLEKSMDGFKSLLDEDSRGMIISRKHPVDLVEKYGIKRKWTTLVWLTKNPRGEKEEEDIETIAPGSLSPLSTVVGEFLGKDDNRVIHMTGLPNLINNTGFKSVMSFVSWSIDNVLSADGNFILSLPEKALEPKNFNILKDEFDKVKK